MAVERLPNFFIIGAPKCGTTALWEYLATHPGIYMSPRKEPHYFNFDAAYRHVRSPEEYVSLFRDAPPSAKILGEASVWYLHSRAAVPEILKTVEDPRFVVMVRNPVDMFASLHEQLTVSGRETIQDPEKAWEAQERRGRGIDVPKSAVEPSHLQYRDVCSLGAQLERVLAVAPRERVHWIVFDEFARNTHAEYLKVLAFLGLEDDGRHAFPRINSAKALRSQLLSDFTRLIKRMKRATGIERGFGIVGHLKRVNVDYRDRPPLRPEFRAELARVFSDDVRKLEAITGRDLSAWR